MTMSPHDALQAWQDGKLDEPDAMRLSGATSRFHMYVLARSWDVDMKIGVTLTEAELIDAEGLAAVERGEIVDWDTAQDRIDAAIERGGRRRSVSFAIANAALAGGVVSSETKDLLDRWSRGEISDDELVEAIKK